MYGQVVGMEIIAGVLCLALMGLACACFSLFLRFCLQEGNLLGWYYTFLLASAKRYPSLKYWLKPLGLCVYCYGSWVCVWVWFVGTQTTDSASPLPLSKGEGCYAIELLWLWGFHYVWLKFLLNDKSL
jgi:hypothetical protein